MIRTRTRTVTNHDAAAGVREGTDRALMDAATAGFDATQQAIAERATDTGQLLRSGVPPQRQPDGSVVFGYTADYARGVDKGTPPHMAPIDALRGWARRVLGDESRAGAVWRKIAREGTEGVFFTRDGLDAIHAHLRSRGLSGYITEATR